MAEVTTSRLEELLGDEAESLLGFSTPAISKDRLHLPGPDFVDRVWKDSDRPTTVLRSIEPLSNHGPLD